MLDMQFTRELKVVGFRRCVQIAMVMVVGIVIELERSLDGGS